MQVNLEGCIINLGSGKATSKSWDLGKYLNVIGSADNRRRDNAKQTQAYSSEDTL